MRERVENYWWRSAPPARPLRMLGQIYGAISRRHLTWRERRCERVSVPLISVGNLAVGGSGKTPFVLWLAEGLRRIGHRPVVLCRGDGGTARAVVRVYADSDPAIVGDEACLLAAPGKWPVVSAQDRVAGARFAARLGDVIVLDDGFQYRQLARDCDIVLLPERGLGNGALLPAGPLREPPEALRRADLVVCPHNAQLDGCPAELRFWRWQAEAAALRDVTTSSCQEPRRVLAVAGIARPERFFHALAQRGLVLARCCSFPDHYRYRPRDVRRLLAMGLPVVTTCKDAVKLRRCWPPEQALWVLEQDYRAEPGLLEHIAARVFS